MSDKTKSIFKEMLILITALTIPVSASIFLVKNVKEHFKMDKLFWGPIKEDMRFNGKITNCRQRNDIEYSDDTCEKTLKKFVLDNKINVSTKNLDVFANDNEALDFIFNNDLWVDSKITDRDFFYDDELNSLIKYLEKKSNPNKILYKRLVFYKQIKEIKNGKLSFDNSIYKDVTIEDLMMKKTAGYDIYDKEYINFMIASNILNLHSFQNEFSKTILFYKYILNKNYISEIEFFSKKSPLIMKAFKKTKQTPVPDSYKKYILIEMMKSDSPQRLSIFKNFIKVNKITNKEVERSAIEYGLKNHNAETLLFLYDLNFPKNLMFN